MDMTCKEYGLGWLNKDNVATGYRVTQIPGYPDTQIPRYPDTWIPGYPDTRILDGYDMQRILTWVVE